jgi:glucan biosynthesis protein C
MTLGIVIHTADVYTANPRWVINDPHGSPFFDELISVLCGFRMQAFFIIAGFFSRLLLERKGPGPFLRVRGMRLAVPLISATLVLTTVQGLLLAGSGFLPLADYYASGQWVSYLWFLMNLLVYTALAAAAWPWLRRIRPERLPLLGGAVVLALPLTGMAARALARVGPSHLLPGHVLELSSLLHYLAFFAFGFAYMPGKDPARLRRLAGAAVVLFVIGRAGKMVPGGRVMNLYCDLALQWATSLLCLYLGRLLLNRESRLTARLSEASYSVYLFQQPFVIAFGLLLIRVPVGAWVKFSVVVSAAFTAALSIHLWLIRPCPLLRLLFNGKPPRGLASGPAPVPSAAV